MRRICLKLAVCICVLQASTETSFGQIAVAGTHAKSACISELARVTGFAAARDESGVSLAIPGYRVTEILVAEGDQVTANQDLVRAVRVGGGDDAIGAASGKSSGGGAISFRAPIAGTIVKLDVRIGDLSGGPSASKLPIINMPITQPPRPEAQILISGGSSVDLVVDVPSIYAAKISKGAAAKVVSDEGVNARGIVYAPASDIDPVSQLGHARLSIDPASALRPGQFASAIIETARDCGVAIPISAVSYREGVATVQVLKNASVETREVQTGLFDDANIRIRDHLSIGEAVVVYPGVAIGPNDRVKPVMMDVEGQKKR